MSTLKRVTEILRAGSWPADSADDTIVLSYDERHRRRLRYVAAGGTHFLLDLPRAIVLRSGDGLKLDDERIVCVEAAPEDLVQIIACDGATLVRLAWHIGNRHLPAQLESDRILIRHDPVIIEMLRGLGARVEPVRAAFTPEGGAYAAAPAHLHPGHAHYE
jgi:urease accessory protein